jgi:hypothetical protein
MSLFRQAKKLAWLTPRAAQKAATDWPEDRQRVMRSSQNGSGFLARRLRGGIGGTSSWMRKLPS